MGTEEILFQADEEHGMFCHFCGKDESACECIDPDAYSFETDIDVSEFDSRKSQLIMPDGWTIYILCNAPGMVYIGSEEHYEYANTNGYAPCKISWQQALGYLSHGNGDDGQWKLEIESPLTQYQRDEIYLYNKMWREHGSEK